MKGKNLWSARVKWYKFKDDMAVSVSTKVCRIGDNMSFSPFSLGQIGGKEAEKQTLGVDVWQLFSDRDHIVSTRPIMAPPMVYGLYHTIQLTPAIL